MSSETVAETNYCSNCKKDIAAANFTMHEVHCRRHLVLCEHCREPVPRTEMEQHFTDVHAKVTCSQCAQELEKDQLDGHLESVCPKRQVSCEYCELQVPHCDLAPHLEFCGTRTESCPRCGNFIMHKDLLRHNSSNCTYPEVKPPASQANGVAAYHGFGRRFGHDQRGGFFGRGELDESLSPFGFEDIRRALEVDADGQSLLVEDSDASAAAGELGRGRREKRGSAGFGRNSASRLPEQKKNDTWGRGQKAATNYRSDVNRQREQASPPPIPPDVDYDAMLAMQLTAEDNEEGADDLDPDAHLNQLLTSYENRSFRSQRHRAIPMDVDDVTVPASPPPGYDDFAAADEEMIPCEFCGENFPAFALVHHQSVCDPMVSGLWGPVQDVPPPTFGRNNDLAFNEWKPVAARPPTIPVINNLGSASPAQEHEEERSHHLSDNGDHLLRSDSMEMTMLPCEFCSELLPADSLVQHQAMCEGKPATPRVTTPAAAQPSSGFVSRNQHYPIFPTSTTGSVRRPSDPTGDFPRGISRRGQQNSSGNARPKKRQNVPRTNPSESRAGPPASQHKRSSLTGEPEEELDISIHSRRGSRQSQGRQDGATRTHHTLNSLLSHESMENEAPSGVGERGGQNGRAQGSRRRPPSTGINSSSISTGVSSRTVMRNLQQQDRKQRPSHHRCANTAVLQHCEKRAKGDGTTEGEGNPSSRRPQRERGVQLFNSPSNSRHPPNPNRSRRSSEKQLPEWE